MKKYNQYLNRASRHLSNRADGASDETIVLMNQDKSVDNGIDKTFGFLVYNGNSDKNLSMALIPANFDTERLVATFDYSGDDPAIVITRTFDNIEALNNAGFNVGGVLSDGETSYEIGGKEINYACASIDPTRTIKQFLDFIKLNPQRLKHLDIIANDANAFDGNLTVTFCNPFEKERVQDIQLSTFYSKYQYATDRIGIDFEGNELELSDLSLITCVIPADGAMKFIMKFW